MGHSGYEAHVSERKVSMAPEKMSQDIAGSIGGMAQEVRDLLTVKRVVGDPIEHNGVILVPVVALRGGAGGGGGEGTGQHDEEGSGGGAGFGVMARPVGSYVIRGDDVEWKPAIDPNRVALVVVVVTLLVTRMLKTVVRRFS